MAGLPGCSFSSSKDETRNVRDLLPSYESVLRDFLVNPGLVSHLPRAPFTSGYAPGLPL
jgi:hypothetical protein